MTVSHRALLPCRTDVFAFTLEMLTCVPDNPSARITGRSMEEERGQEKPAMKQSCRVCVCVCVNLSLIVRRESLLRFPRSDRAVRGVRVELVFGVHRDRRLVAAEPFSCCGTLF